MDLESLTAATGDRYAIERERGVAGMAYGHYLLRR